MAEENATPMTWQDLAPTVTAAINATWDLTPFLSAPAVKHKSPGDGKLNILNIPKSKIPSPLADNLSPRQIIDIRESLLGKAWYIGDRDGSSKSGGNGKEIWLSWKRAWDLWNNHYIEDRVNPLWVGEEWERRERAKLEWNKGRDDRRRMRQQEKIAATASNPSLVPLGSVLRPELEVPRPRAMLERDPSQPKVVARESTVSGPSTTTGSERERGRIDDPEESDLELSDAPAISISSDSEESSNSEPPPKPTTNPDGSSAGWFPLKVLPEYHELEDEEWDGKQWFDSLANTVWRPRRVGEKTLQIEVDKDIEHFRKNTKFEVDGGVDCGRSPLPVLRPITQYVRTAEGAFRKKKVWDGVTETIFNLPTQPLEPRPEMKDEISNRIRAMYYDPVRDPKDLKVFPLDIRRVLKVKPGIEKPRGICDKDEELVRDPNLYPKKQYRHMKEDDPWWVEDSQRLARDAPPRCHPPKNEDKTLGENLPLDDRLWEAEVCRDQQHDAGYFVTNLHGTTLVVNGMEIKKGDVAGPLPAFAIIESPGGQISFWWGVGGRHYGSGPEGTDFSAKWEILRKEPGWQHVAKSAGEVWDAKIRDRQEREKTGEDEDDDEEWEGYKQAKGTKKTPEAKVEDFSQPGHYSHVPIFTNDDNELKWLYFQEQETKAMLEVKRKLSVLSYPNKNDFWPGTVSQVELLHELPQPAKDARWKEVRDAQILLQQSVQDQVATEKARVQAKELENKKRQAEELLQSMSKRQKKNDKIRKDAAGRAAKIEKATNDAKANRELYKAIEKKYLDDMAKMASMFRDSDLTAEERFKAFQEWTKAEENILESQRQKINEDRRKEGRPEIPAPEKLDPAIVEAAIAQEKEDARARDKQGTQDAARHVQNQQAQPDVRESTDTQRLAESERLAQTLAEQQAQRTSEAAERKRKAVADQIQQDVAERKRAVAARLAQELAAKSHPLNTLQALFGLKPGLARPKQAPLSRPAPRPPALPPYVSPAVPPPANPPPTIPTPVTIPPSAKYPSTINQNLQHAINEGDIWDPEVQQAMENSLKSFAVEANQALSVRAASMNMTEDEYAQSQGHANAEAYLKSHIQDVTNEMPISPVSPKKPATETEKWDSHLEERKQEMLKSIKQGIRNMGVRAGFRNQKTFAKDRGYASVDAWAEADLNNMNITLDMIPSRKHESEMTVAEQLLDDAVWKEWVGSINAAARWEDRIAALPQGPGWSRARKMGTRKFAAV